VTALDDMLTKDVKLGDDQSIETAAIESEGDNEAVIVILSDTLNTVLVATAEIIGTVVCTIFTRQTAVDEIPNLLVTWTVMEIASIAEKSPLGSILNVEEFKDTKFGHFWPNTGLRT
jgi:hypothetical protein